MGKLALLIGPPQDGPREHSEPDGDEEMDIASSPEFSEMCKAFFEAAGIEPKNEEKACRRFVALLNIWCDLHDYGGHSGQGGYGGKTGY